MSLVWLVLTNGNIPAIAAAMICLQMTKFFQRTGFGKSNTFFGSLVYFPYMMGLGQGNRVAPPSWIQLSAVMVSVFRQLNLGAMVKDPITAKIVHSMGAMFVDNVDLYTWREDILDQGELWCQAQIDLEHWSCLLNATGGVLKPEKCFWYKSKTAFGTKALFWDQGLCPLISAPVIRFQSRKVYQRLGMVLRVGGCTLFGVPTTFSMASGCLSAKTQKVASKYLHNLFTQEEEF